MVYRSTLACFAVLFLALAVVAGVERNQPAQAFCLSQGDCAAASNFNFTGLTAPDPAQNFF
jgi:hypothetical protein